MADIAHYVRDPGCVHVAANTLFPRGLRNASAHRAWPIAYVGAVALAVRPKAAISGSNAQGTSKLTQSTKDIASSVLLVGLALAVSL